MYYCAAKAIIKSDGIYSFETIKCYSKSAANYNMECARSTKFPLLDMGIL